MANKSIIDVDTLNSLADSDSLFVNSDGSLKQVAVEEAGLMRMELLWENASPTSAFSAQTINDIDISSYNYVMIICNYANTYPKRLMPPALCPVTIGYQGACITPETARTIEIASMSAISIGGTSTGDLAYLVPYRIYGIKGIQQ